MWHDRRVIVANHKAATFYHNISKKMSQYMWRLATWLYNTDYRSGMSNSNNCVGRTLSFKARKACTRPQFGKTCYSVSILDIF